MRLSIAVWAVGLLAAPAAALAADKPRIAPPEPWVLPPPAAASPAKASAGAAVAVLLQDAQVRFDATGASTFVELQAKVQSGAGLSSLGTVSLAWSPATDTLTVHRLRILRDGQAIDRLPKDGAFTVLRREARLETAAMLDGVLTAVVQPEGLQVGDVLDLAYTLRREDPLLKGRFDADLLGFDAAPLGTLRIRALWPKGSGVSWRVADGLAPPRLSEHDGQVEARIEAQEVLPLAKPQGAPPRFQLGREFVVSNYADWSDVAALMAPLFEQAERLPADSAVAAEARAIAARSKDPVVRTEAALALVQDKVRYFLQAIGDGGLKPASADETWTRRWGDCKAKTALLLALLKALGVQAEPVLASSVRGAGLDGRLPSLSAFDHVLVRATIGGRDYWLDGTRLGDTSLDAISTPNFGFVLPVRASGATLVRLTPEPAKSPLSRTTIRIDASKGIDKPAPFHVETAFRGDGATVLKLQLANLAPDDLDRALRTYWRAQYDFVTPSKVSAAFDAKAGEERLVMDGEAKMDWSNGGYEADGAVLGWRLDPQRDPGPHADAPFALDFPSYSQTDETIVLPDGGKGFTVGGEQVDKELAGYAFHRKAVVEGGAFRMETSSRALKPEITLAQAQKDAAAVTELGKGTLRVQSPAQSAAAAAGDPDAAEPTTRDGYLTRGDARAHARRFAEALHDFDKAVSLDPGSAVALAARATMRGELKQDFAAKVDFDRAEALDPNEPQVWRFKAAFALEREQFAEAAAAATQLLRLEPGDVAVRTLRAGAEVELGDADSALADRKALLAAGVDDPANHEIWARAYGLKKDFPKARLEVDAWRPLSTAEKDLPAAKVDLLWQLGDREGTRAAADRLLAVTPDAEVYVIRAAVRPAADSAGRLADIKAAYALDPTSFNAASNLARMELNLGDYETALAAAKRAEMLDPKSPAPAWVRAKIAVKRGDAKEARSRFDSSRTLAGRDAGGLNDLCYEEATVNFDLPQALADCDASLALRPNDGATLDSRAFVLLRLGRDREARATYDAALARRPDQAGSLYGRSLAERRLGDVAAADADLKAAIAKDPKVVETFTGYGVTR